MGSKRVLKELKNLQKDPPTSCSAVASFSCAMITVPFAYSVPPQFLPWHPLKSVPDSFWELEYVHEHLRKLRETIDLTKALKSELEEILLIKGSRKRNSSSSNDSIAANDSQQLEDDSIMQTSKLIEAKRIRLDAQESISIEAANSILQTLKCQLAPLNVITSPATPWEERSVAVKFANKLRKSKRNKLWKKRKRKQVADLARKLREDYDKADQDADEWRAREIAKDIARRKVESMKEIAKLKAKEERKRLESELELFLVVENLQELRTIRIQKLKKQGHFLPEEDDKFLERVRAAVEEEERQAVAAADTHAAKDAIATAESRKIMQNTITEGNVVDQIEREPCRTKGQSERSLGMDASPKSEQWKDDVQGYGGGYDSVSNLPFEFLHYYHGSNNDMGTLIEVRRTWDAYIRPGGSRMPGHWVQPPPPADEVWASYLVQPK